MRGLIGETEMKGLGGLIGGQLKKEERAQLARIGSKPADREQRWAVEQERRQRAKRPAAKRKASELEELYAERQENVKVMQTVRAQLGVLRFSAYYCSDEDGEQSGSDTDGADAGATMSAPDVGSNERRGLQSSRSGGVCELGVFKTVTKAE
jgi:predicted secreted protein